MATPQEIVARWDAIEAEKKAAIEAKKRAAGPANDNRPRAPDGYITIDGEEPMPYWLGAAARDCDVA
jgi:hypothetical protein